MTELSKLFSSRFASIWRCIECRPFPSLFPSGEVVRRGDSGGLLAFDSHSRVVVVRGWDLIPVPSVLVLSQLRAEGLCHRKIDDVVVTGLGFDPMTFCILGRTLTARLGTRSILECYLGIKEACKVKANIQVS